MSLEFIIFDGHYHLIVVPFHHVAVAEHPLALASGFVILELPLEVAAVGVGPLPANKPVLNPVSHILHASGVEDVGALAVFLAL